MQSDRSLERDDTITRLNSNVSSHLGEQFSKMPLEVKICREHEYCISMADPQRLDIQSCPHVVEQYSMSFLSLFSLNAFLVTSFDIQTLISKANSTFSSPVTLVTRLTTDSSDFEPRR